METVRRNNEGEENAIRDAVTLMNGGKTLTAE